MPESIKESIKGQDFYRALAREQDRDGELSLSEQLRCKTRWFMDSGVIGGREFVKNVVEGLRGGYLSEKRKGEGSKVPNHRGELWSMRQLE